MATKKAAFTRAAYPTLKLKLTSSRAPYTRGGVSFASNRTPVVLGHDEITSAQLVKIIADPAIALALTDPETGLSAPLPADLFDETGKPDEARLAEIAEALLADVAKAPKPTPEPPKEGDDA